MRFISYTVTQVRGCRTIDRPVPIDDMVALIGAWSQNVAEEWFCDALLGDHLGCALVAGPKAALNAWRAELGLEPMA
ncbi:MAG: hypothetical protein ACXWVD_00325 [Telluria sp.]